MADRIDLKITGLDAALRTLGNLGKAAQNIARNSLNDTAKHARTLAVRDITAEWNIKAKDVRQTFDIKRATSANLTAELVSKGKPIPLVYFDAKWDQRKGQGVRYRVKKKDGRKVLRGAFIRRLAGGLRQGVGIREAASRLPIVERAVPGVYHAWRSRLDSELPDVAAFLRRRVAQLVALELERRGR